MKKRKSNFKASMRRMEEARNNASGVILDKDPKKAELEMRMLGIVTRVKKEGIS